jgi:outer membrane protein insertion porin family
MSMEWITRSFTIVLLVLSVQVVYAQTEGDSWVVRNFEVEGAQRIAEGTIYNYLPINIGDTITSQRVQEGIRAIYAAGFFTDVEFRRSGDTLVIAVLERPTIEDFTIEGNSEIDTEQLEEAMRNVGLARGRVFDQSVLENIRQALTETYFARGRYAVQIETPVEELGDGRVTVAINIDEGQRARIRQINLVGNTSFADDEIISGFQSSTGGWLTWIRADDRYAKVALEGDLEALRAFYMDRGFADFRYDSVQVAISPDKRDIFITINVTEGDRYTIADINLNGDLVVPAEELREQIRANPGEIFSQEILSISEQLIRNRLGLDGYALAQVQAIPDLNEETLEADITFFIDPQSRVYVRRINFNGADNVNDEVFRREMRQLEGSYLSNMLVERSQVRLQRLPYVESVEFETVPVPGMNDLVDIEFQIAEGLPGQFGGGLGFSEYYGLTLNANFVHSNFMGTGNRLGVQLNGGDFFKTYTFSYTDPYRNIDGLQRTLSFTWRDMQQYTAATSDFSTETATISSNWAYPLTEYQFASFGLSYSAAELATSYFSSDQANYWVQHNGRPFDIPGGVAGRSFATAVDTVDLSLGWSFDSRDRVIFPNRGTRIAFTLSGSVPGSDAEFYVTNLEFTQFLPLFGQWMGMIGSNISFGEAYGDYTTTLPPFRNFYGGGPGSVRGYKESWMGPRDSLNYPSGGNLLISNQFELIIPTPEAMRNQSRVSLFYDVGNVFHTGGVEFFDRLGDPISHAFDTDGLKHSVGLAVEWLSPMGLLKFSFAAPLSAVEESEREWGDRTEEFQFEIGNAF